MQTKRKSFISLILTAVMLFSMLLSGTQAVLAAPVGEPLGYVTLSIEKFVLGQGYIVEPVIVPFYENSVTTYNKDTISILVSRALGGQYLHTVGSTRGVAGTSEGNFSYLSHVKDDDTGLDNLPSYLTTLPDPAVGTAGRRRAGYLGELDYAASNIGSGWVYYVNNDFPSVGMSAKTPTDGDVIRLQYTLYLGSLSPNNGSTNIIENRDELSKQIAAVNSAENKEELLSNPDIETAYTYANTIMTDLDSIQLEIDAATTGLSNALSAPTAPVEPLGYVTMSADANTLGIGFLYEPLKIPFYQGESYFDVTARFFGAGNYKGSSAISAVKLPDPDVNISIAQVVLDELEDYADEEDILEEGRSDSSYLSMGDYDIFWGYYAGWMYSVNDEFSSLGASNDYPLDGDVCRWQFSLYGLGADLGKDVSWGSEAFYDGANRDALTALTGEINAAPNKVELLAKAGVQVVYDSAYTVLTNLTASQTDVDNAFNALDGALNPLQVWLTYGASTAGPFDPIPTGGGADYVSNAAIILRANGEAKLPGSAITYRWVRTALSNGTVYEYSAGQNVTTLTNVGSFEYYCKATYTPTGGTAITVESERFVVTRHLAGIAGEVIIGTQPISSSYVIGVSMPISVSASRSPAVGTLTYHWYESSDNLVFNPINGASAASYTPVALEESGIRYYYCKVTNTAINDGLVNSTTLDSNVATIENISSSTFGWGGAGTESDPYTLADKAALETLSGLVNNSGISFQGKYFKITNDISLDIDWTPIGTTTRMFSASFDADGHTINFAFGSKPLFGVTSGYAVIKNMNIYGEYIADHGLIAGHVNSSAFSSGSSLYTIIDNVTIKSGTTIKRSGFIGDPGGIIVSNGSVFQADIRNSTVEKGVKIGWDAENNQPTNHSDGFTKGGYGIGPGVGSFAETLGGSITNCVSYATVYGQDKVGGIVGYKVQSMRNFRVNDCVFAGEIIASGNYVGGIVGSGYDTVSAGLSGFSAAPNTPGVGIRNCYVTGTITGNNYVGGILGSEGGQMQEWDNGIGYGSGIQNNLFVGTAGATTAGEQIIGAIIGSKNTLNCFGVIERNYYLDICGAEKGIYEINYIDTSHENPADIDGVRYYNTANGAPNPSIGGVTRYGPTYKYNRTDDPLGEDKDSLAMAVTAEMLKDGTVLNLLNGGANSSGNWLQGDYYPVFHDSQPGMAEAVTESGMVTSVYVGLRGFNEVVLIAASYVDNKLVSVKPITVKESGETPVNLQTPEGGYVKLMLWEDWSNISSLCLAQTVYE